ncbi:hypothetical protein [Leptolyngbya phage Lbo-JY46]
MPAPGSKFKIGNRHPSLTKDLYNDYIKEGGENITYKEFTDIVKEANDLVIDAILEDISGFKLPYNLGYIVVNKFKGRYTKPDYKNTLKYNKTIPLLNLHSFGFIYKIAWFKTTNTKGIHSNSRLFPYKLNFNRIFKRALAKKIKEGKIYDSWQKADFYYKSKTGKKFNP